MHKDLRMRSNFRRFFASGISLLLLVNADTTSWGKAWKTKSAPQGVEALLVDVADGRIELEIAEGKTIKLAIDELVDEDRKFLAETAQPQLAELHYNRGSSELDQGNYEVAVDAFSNALRLHPDYPEAFT